MRRPPLYAQMHLRPRQGLQDIFLTPDDGAPQPGAPDLQGVLAAPPVSRPWSYKNQTTKGTVSVSRTNVPLLPQKQCTLHGVKGKTAGPGFIAHWTFLAGVSKESIWLAYYVSLSRPRSFPKFLSHGLPDRSIVEKGPPEQIAKAFKEMFAKKIAKTKVACAKARAQMGWPCRPN